jgi:DNA-binding NtrC family response regulator
LSRAIELYPDEGCAIYNLGLCEAELGNHDRAIELYGRAIELNWSVGRAHHNSGNSYRALSDRAWKEGKQEEAERLLLGAIECFSKAVERIPDFPLALRALGSCFFKLGYYDEAIRYYNRAIKIVPTDLLAWRGKFRIYAKRGDHDKLLEEIDTLRRWCGGLGSAEDLLRSCEGLVKDLVAARRKRVSGEDIAELQRAIEHCGYSIGGKIEGGLKGLVAQAPAVPVKRQAGPQLRKPWVASCEPLDKKERRRLIAIKQRIDKKGQVVGEGAAMLRVFERIHELNQAKETTPLVLLGDTGVGKTFLVPLIVSSSSRAGKKYASINASRFCGVDFNITKGEFLGFSKGHGVPGIPMEGKKGWLESCQGGTIFIDELVWLSPQMQALLLTILDGADAHRVGDSEIGFHPDVRFIFATNRDPDEEIVKGNLEHDLWRRLRRSAIAIPSLKDRKEDIPLLARAFLGGREIEPEALLALMLFEWPGNVGELSNALGNLPKQSGRRGKVRRSELPTDIAETVGAIDPTQAESRLAVLLVAQLKARGLELGKGLNKEFARLRGVSEATASKLLKQAGV